MKTSFMLPQRDSTPRPTSLTWIDYTLIVVFLLGLYTNYTIQVSVTIPFPSVPCGIAGILLLWRHREQISSKALMGLCVVLFAYIVSILCATNLAFLPRRFNGLVQLTYSLVIGYALFLTVVQGTRKHIGRLFLTFSLIILIGCVLERNTGLKSVSDEVRRILYSDIYENDLRDVLLYNKVRPKLFASEPSSVTFCYALFTFIWMVVSESKLKLPIYVGMIGIGLFVLPGPTLLLMVLLLLPYLLFLASRRNGRLDMTRLLLVFCVSVAVAVGFVVLGETMFAERLRDIESGSDPSFFFRVQGPALAGINIMHHYPFAGAGLTGELFMENVVINVYARSAAFSSGWDTAMTAKDLVINYFWLHWIYLGLIMGLIVSIALSVWLRTLGIPSIAFCWLVWAIMGQASGAYVGPTCWAVMFLAGAAAKLNQSTFLR